MYWLTMWDRLNTSRTWLRTGVHHGREFTDLIARKAQDLQTWTIDYFMDWED